MENGIGNGLPILEVLDDDALEQLWSDPGVPDAFGIDDHDRSVDAHSEAWRLSTLDASRAEQEILLLQQLGEERIDLAAAPIGRAEITGAHQDMA